MPIKTRELESKLQVKFGFSPSKTHSKDHRWYELKISGLPLILTKVSHGANEISSSGLENRIAKQLRVRVTFFRGMIKCSNNSDAYQKQVSENPYPPYNTSFK
jgi:hypothetical protein